MAVFRQIHSDPQDRTSRVDVSLSECPAAARSRNLVCRRMPQRATVAKRKGRSVTLFLLAFAAAGLVSAQVRPPNPYGEGKR